jgi:hypothetical protein
MQTIELLAGMNQASRELGALRWGIPCSAPRFMAENLKKHRNAQRVFRRGTDVAPVLIKLLVESAGHPVLRTENLEDEASRLRGWFPFVETPTHWHIPRDLACVLARFAETERFFALGILAHISTDDLRALLAELELVPLGSVTFQIVQVADKILAQSPNPGITETAKKTVELGALALKEIQSIRYVVGSRGTRFSVFTESAEYELCPREFAIALGLSRVHDTVDVPVVSSARSARARLPDVLKIGALVTFSTARAADEAIRLPEFRDIVARRLDERRFVTHESHAASETLLLLEGLGFNQDEL